MKQFDVISDEQTARVHNFGRFFVTFNKMRVRGDREEVRRGLVKQYTSGRTESMKEMTLNEYNAMCYDLERGQSKDTNLKRQRRICLKLMTEIGVDTTDWKRINQFCRNRRIADEVFYRLTEEELFKLEMKLRAIKQRGGLKKEFDSSRGRIFLSLIIRKDNN
jgi:hypothetical protein